MAYHAELWDRRSATWRTLEAQARPRLYHSTALLLADGRVVSMGGGAPGPLELNAETFLPPYLYAAGQLRARPTFSVANGSGSFEYGESVSLRVSNLASARASLVKLGSCTHSHNTEQRYLPLKGVADRARGVYTVTMPLAAHLAPPGFYMLTVIDANGVPSQSQVVRLRP